MPGASDESVLSTCCHGDMGPARHLSYPQLGSCCRAWAGGPPLGQFSSPQDNKTPSSYDVFRRDLSDPWEVITFCQACLFSINVNQCPISAGDQPDTCQGSGYSWTCPPCCPSYWVTHKKGQCKHTEMSCL